MEFKEFINITRPILKGENLSSFVSTLFQEIVSEEGITYLKERSNDTLKAYGNGNSKITKLAYDIADFIDCKKFANYINDCTLATRKKLCTEFAPYIDDLTVRNIGKKLSEFFRNIITEAASGSGTANKKKSFHQKGASASFGTATAHIPQNETAVSDRGIFELSRQIDELVEKLEIIQGKIDNAKNDSWAQIYSDQFQMTFFTFRYLKTEAERKQSQAQKMLTEKLFSPVSPTENAHSAGVSSANKPTGASQELTDLWNWVDNSLIKADSIERELESILEDAIYAYLLDEDCSNEKMIAAIDALPHTRAAATALLRLLTESFDGLIELYNALFERYTEFLTPEEMKMLTNCAKQTWDPFILEGWGL